MPNDLLYRVDRAVGEGLEKALRTHHRRRLGRVGWQRAFDPRPGWAAGYPPPRPGNDVEVLIDGEQGFRALTTAIREARSHVHLTGWHLVPDFVLAEHPERLRLRELLREVAGRVDVRVLTWAGAPLPPPFRPSRREMRAVRDELLDDTGIEFALDAKQRLAHCHHEKIAIVDDAVAFVGGLDLTTMGGDRLDSNDHRARGELGWHDVTTRLAGPIVVDVAEHFRMRWQEVTGEGLLPTPPQADAGRVTLQLVRTVPEGVYDALPRGDFRILESYVEALRSARKLVYLETQFLWSSEIVKILAEKLAHPPSDDFRVIALLPSKPTTGNDDTLGQLALLAEADHQGERFLACTLYARAGDRADSIYVHAKVGIVDDEWLTIGSANLNNHSLFNDSEVNVVARDARLAAETRRRLWSEHLEVPIDELSRDPTADFEQRWKPIAVEQATRFNEARPLTHRLVRLPSVSKRAKRLLGPLQTLVVDA